ncbi:MAG: hypothetical protein QHH02_07480 [Syntrophomonadaceae bacterium]|nr:hypothetical protein [Syntrophomonadaceae bacterium]
MDFDKEGLWRACYNIACDKAREGRPVDVKLIRRLADVLFMDAIFYRDYLEKTGQDPNMLVRAVQYLAHSHSNPYLNDDQRLISWFSNSLDILMELVSPSVEATRESIQFLKDVLAGVSRTITLLEGSTFPENPSNFNPPGVTVRGRNPEESERNG